MLAAGCSTSRPPQTVSVSIFGDQADHPTGQRFYPAGQGVPAVPAPANTNGLYLLTPRDLHHLLLP